MIVDVLRQRMMVAEFVARQQSGSPVNGETPTNHNNSNMPAHSALLLTNGGPMSPQSPGPENFPSNNYDLSAHLRKKDLFSQRKQREFIPDAKKDESYWDRRRRNNEAAKRSREKRRFNDMVLEQRVVELTKENHVLKAQLEAIKDKYNICGENLVSVDQIMATLPTSEQVLSITKRPKLNHSVSPQRMMYPGSPSPVPTSVIHQNISNNSSSSCSNSNTSPSPPGLMQQRDPTPQQHIGSPGSPSPMPNAVPPQSALQLHPQPHHHHLHQPHHPSGIPPHALIHAQQQQASQHPHHHISSQQGQSPHNMASPFGIRREQPPTHNSSSASSSPPVQQHHHGLPPGVVGVVPPPQQQQQQPHDEYTTTTTTSSSTPHHYALYEPVPTHFQQGTSVLNLSRRAHSPSYEASSVASSVEDDHDMHADQQNNSLPLKLRHKSHLGDKDAATALLALHNIKQEPNPRASPPWDGEGSSDERDSGISIGASDWTATIQRKIIVNHQAESNAMHDKEEENIHLKSKLARLESEVATIKNMMILNTSNGATAAAQ